VKSKRKELRGEINNSAITAGDFTPLPSTIDNKPNRESEGAGGRGEK
jgi:hypothetical protein